MYFSNNDEQDSHSARDFRDAAQLKMPKYDKAFHLSSDKSATIRKRARRESRERANLGHDVLSVNCLLNSSLMPAPETGTPNRVSTGPCQNECRRLDLGINIHSQEWKQRYFTSRYETVGVDIDASNLLKTMERVFDEDCVLRHSIDTAVAISNPIVYLSLKIGRVGRSRRNN